MLPDFIDEMEINTSMITKGFVASVTLLLRKSSQNAKAMRCIKSARRF